MSRADGDRQTEDVTYADDVALTALCTCMTLTDTIDILVSTAYKRFMQYGMVVNFKPGKSGVLAGIHGTGSQQARTDYYATPMKAVDTDIGTVYVSKERSYKHLGGVVEADGSFGPEIRRRKVQHAVALRPLQKGILAKGFVSESTGAKYVDALSNSKLLYQCESWPQHAQGIQQQLESTYMRGYRAAAKCLSHSATTDHKTDDWTLTQVERVPLADVIRVRRLRYLAAILTSGPATLRALLDLTWDKPTSWTSQLNADFDWLKSSTRADDFPDAGDTDAWLDSIRKDTDIFLKKLTAAWKRHKEWRLEELRRREWARELLKQDPVPEPPTQLDVVLCYDCGEVFPSVQAWRTHRTQKHTVRYDAQRYAIGGYCAACGRHQRSRARLLYHLRYSSKACLRTLARIMEPLSPEEVEALKARDAVDRQALKEAGYHPEKALQPVDRRAGPRMHRPGDGRGDAPPPAWTTLEVEKQTCSSRPQHNLHTNHFVLHLFSGQRRAGDLQMQIEELCRDRAVWVLSLDVCNDEVWGDMSRPATIREWVRRIHEGQVVGVAGGPPCESWSAARFWDIRSGDGSVRRGPRPLRLRDQPWGLPCLTEAERRQVNTGNALLRAMVTMLYACAARGIPGVMEHPAPAHWQPRAASVFRTAEILRLRQHPHVELLTVDQCMFGQSARKPTCFLTVFMPALKTRLQDMENGGRCTHAHGHQTALGLDEHGQFKTTRLKAYPTALCAWLARGFEGYMQENTRPLTHEAPSLPADVERFFMPLDPYYAYQMGRDYATTRRGREREADWVIRGDSRERA